MIWLAITRPLPPLPQTSYMNATQFTRELDQAFSKQHAETKAHLSIAHGAHLFLYR